MQADKMTLLRRRVAELVGDETIKTSENISAAVGRVERPVGGGR